MSQGGGAKDRRPPPTSVRLCVFSRRGEGVRVPGAHALCPPRPRRQELSRLIKEPQVRHSNS